MPGKSMEKRDEQTLFSSISYCFFVSISFPDRLLKPRHSKLLTRMIPAWAVANCMRTHSYLLGPHIPSRSPFLRPRARIPAAAWSTWKIPHKNLRITHRMQWGILVSRHCFPEKKHRLCNWNATDWISPERSISPWLQQLLSLEHRPAPAQQVDWKHKNNKSGTIQQSRK